MQQGALLSHALRSKLLMHMASHSLTPTPLLFILNKLANCGAVVRGAGNDTAELRFKRMRGSTSLDSGNGEKLNPESALREAPLGRKKKICLSLRPLLLLFSVHLQTPYILI